MLQVMPGKHGRQMQREKKPTFQCLEQVFSLYLLQMDSLLQK